jgi:hypothetical protein
MSAQVPLTANPPRTEPPVSGGLVRGISSDAVSGIEWLFVGFAAPLDLATRVGVRQLLRR